jgi:hypothetical protein
MKGLFCPLSLFREVRKVVVWEAVEQQLKRGKPGNILAFLLRIFRFSESGFRLST